MNQVPQPLARAVRTLQRGSQAGFTLVEVLVVLLIMSGILVTITQVLNSARATRDLIHNINETQMAGPAILDHVERDLRAMFVYDRGPENVLYVEDRTISGFDADTMAFVTSTNSLMLTEDTTGGGRFVQGDYGEVGYVLRPNPEAPNDFLEVWRREQFGVDELPFEGGQFAFLHDRVKGFDIQVFSDNGEDSEPLDEWGVDDNDSEAIGLPARIEITLTLELAPRLVRETMPIARVDKRTVTYRRIVRFNERLRNALGQVRPVALIPNITPPIPGNSPGTNVDAAGDGSNGSDDGGLQLSPEGADLTLTGGFGGGDGGGGGGLPPGGLDLFGGG